MSIDAAWAPHVQQDVFRILLEATAHPGRLFELPGKQSGLHQAMALLATLVDGAVTLHDRTRSLDRRAWNFLQAEEAGPEAARFILDQGSRTPDFTPCLGELESPETGATLVLLVSSLGRGPLRLLLEGPGIETRQELCLDGMSPAWVQAREGWNHAFPLGVDMYVLDDARICGLPRTTRIINQDR